MLVFKRNIRGETVSMELNVTSLQLDRYFGGEGHVQDIFPDLKACEREFLITGTTPKMWEEMFMGCTWHCNPCPYNIRHISENEELENDDEWQGEQT